jgi:hypothetical protein
MRILGVVMLCAALAGCATKYQEMGFTGDVAAQQITADTWRILSRRNAYTASTTVQDYVLLKAAETTQAAGGAYFQIVSAGDASRASTFVTPGTSTTTVVGNQAFKTTLSDRDVPFISGTIQRFGQKLRCADLDQSVARG